MTLLNKRVEKVISQFLPVNAPKLRLKVHFLSILGVEGSQKIENLWKCFAKISVTKFRKWKIRDGHFINFSMLFVVVYFVFSVDAFFMEKIVKQNRLFWLFLQNRKKAILFRNFLHEKCINRKNKVHHNEEHRKKNKLYISIFFLFLKLCHRDFCKTFSEIFNFFLKIKKQRIHCQNSRFCFTIFSMENPSTEKKQSTPQRAQKNEDDGSLHFFHRPPESDLILHRSCIIYDGQN